MKTYFNYALLSAIAFVGATGFTACSSSDEVAETNPNYNPETNSVKTEFVINVTQPVERTRMAADDAGAGAFQGLNDMYLLCFPSTPGTSTSIATGHELSLAGYPSASLNGTTPTQTDNSSKWYTLYIPTTTSNFLFYAKTVSGTPAAPATTGKLNYIVSGLTSVGNIGFSLAPIASAMTSDENTLLGYLNPIVAAKDGTDASKTWESTVVKRDASNSESPHYKALADAYQQFISTSTSGVRQGSARAILSTITDLHASVKAVSNTETGDPKLIADAVLAAIELKFNIDGTTGAASFKDTPLPTTTTAYPQNLPDGSAILTFNSATKQFAYTNNGTIGAATIATAMNKFTYPSELTYYCNSTLRATSSNVTTSTLPTTSADWLTESKWDGWSQTAVDASTRAVAMKENVTYGVAQLYSTVSSSVSTFTDNAEYVTTYDGITGNDIANQSIDLSGASDYLKVTGIIIGGQPTTAGYDYLPSSTSTDYAIYDKVDATGSSAGTLIVGNGTTPTATYYTLALDNYDSSKGDNEKQNPVNVAVEFVASKDFFGKDGLIKAGQSFYLIGELNPTSFASTAIDWTKHVSFKSTEPAYGKNRVFIRDAKTTATFTLSATSLQNAYSTIPDLRSTQMVFGLSVDLAWKPGLSFNVNF